MSNVTNIPLENAYNSNLSGSISAAIGTVVVDKAVGFTLPAGQTVDAVIDPENSRRERVKVTAIDATGKIWTVTRAQADYLGHTATAYSHSGGAKIVITDSWSVFNDAATAINSKLDADGGNTGANFDLSLTTTDFRIRRDGDDMKFRDNNQSEVTLSALAAAAGVDEKAKVSNLDTTAGYLEDKVITGTNVTVTKINAGANEKLRLDSVVPEIITEHTTYAPAYLTGGSSAQSDPALWDSVSDGEFSITIDGVAYDVTGIDFTPAVGGDMDDMAAVIQAAIRAETGSTETCVWSTDHFVISSVDTTISSAITVTSTVGGGTGTDISGAGASDWMDCDTGNGTVTDCVLDPTADAGKVWKSTSTGKLSGAAIERLFGGDGTDGALNVAGGTTTLNLGQVYNFTTITVAAGATLTFTGTGGAMMLATGAVNIEGTIELRNMVDSVQYAALYGYEASSGSARQSFTPNTGGAGGSKGAAGAGDGGAGGTSTAASATPGVGGAGGAAGANGTAGEGGASTTGGGGGGGGGGEGGTAGTNGSTTATTAGGAGGVGGEGNSDPEDGGGGGGGGGGYNTGNGGAGANGGRGYGYTSKSGVGGTGGNSGANGGNGGNGGAGGTGGAAGGALGSGNAGNGGNGGDGYVNGGNGGAGSAGNVATQGPGSNGGNGGVGLTGTGGTGGAGGANGTANTGTPAKGGDGGAGGAGRNGGTGGAGGTGMAYTGAGGATAGAGGAGGAGGNGSSGATFLILQTASDLTISGTVEAGGGNGGDGGAGGAGGTNSHATSLPGIGGNGGNGGSGGDGADVIMVCLGTLTNSATVNNAGGTGGTGGRGGRPGTTVTAYKNYEGYDGARGIDGKDGHTLIAKISY